MGLKRLQELRKQKMTQADLAKRIECATNTISQLENGFMGISLRMAFALSDALGYQIDPSGSIRKSFSKLDYVSFYSVKYAADQLGIAFDPDELFKEE